MRVELAVRHASDAILLDMVTPQQDSPGTLRELRSPPATDDIPIVSLTARIRAEDVQRLLDLDAGVVGGPFDPLELPGRLSTLLGWSA